MEETERTVLRRRGIPGLRCAVRCLVFPVLIAAAMSSAVSADEYDVAIQAKHSLGLLHADFDNMDCAATGITMDIPKLSTPAQIFLYHTPTTGDAGVFDFRREKWVFSGGAVTFNPWYRYNDGVPDCGKAYTPTVTGNYALYKSFSFPSDLPVSASVKKLIVLIHGWNPDEMENPYKGYGWPDLIVRLDAWVNAHPDWTVLAYNWAEDAATGPILDTSQGGLNLLANAIRNGTQAAEISHQHGLRLGPLLASKLPNLEKIQFIAHSAGTWNARAAAVYLSRNCPSIRIQITLLDPYIPGEAPDTASSCTIGRVNQLATLAHMVLLENYYYSNDVPGTQSVFSWRGDDINRKLGSSLLPNPYNHMAPIKWYADTIGDTAIDGWSQSLAYNDTPGNVAVSEPDFAPGAFTVSEPLPNPFNPSTAITYTLGRELRVRLAVYDILGREVAVLAEGVKGAGVHLATWDGADGNGKRAASGVYLYRLTAEGRSAGGKMMLAR